MENMNNQEILNGSKFDISEYISALKLDNADLTNILKELVKLFWQEKTPSQDNKGNIGTEQEGEIQEEIILEDKAQRERNQYDLRWLFGLSRKPHNPDNWEPNWNNWNNRIDDIKNLYNAGDKLYTLSVYDIVSNIVCAIHEQVKAQVDLSQELKETINKQKETVNKRYNAIIKLGDILHESDFKFKVSNDVTYPEIRKDYLHKLDGMDILISEKGINDFVRLAIAGSYFFDPELVKEANMELLEDFKNSIEIGKAIETDTWKCIASSKDEDIRNFVENIKGDIDQEKKDNLQKVNKFINNLTKEQVKDTIDGKDSQLEQLNTYRNELINGLAYLKARYTIDGKIVKNNKKLKKGDKAVYTIKDPISNKELKYRVHIDIDGNRFVRNLINEKTGIIVSQGKNSILQNTIISHIWGRAYDPRYFTSLWNIVLIPAWANSLMDKEDAPEGTLASKMRATYMKICTELYGKVPFLSSSDPENDEQFGNYLTGLPAIKNYGDVITGQYTFNLIKAKKERNIPQNKKDYFIDIDRDSKYI